MDRDAVTRVLALALCLITLALPLSACADNWKPPVEEYDYIGVISGKILEWCMMDDFDEVEFIFKKSLVQRFSRDDLADRIYREANTYSNSYKMSWKFRDDGSCYVRLYDIKLRSGLKMLAAYYNGDQSRLTSDEKKALQKISKAVNDLLRKYPRESVELELAIYDYICDHLEYRAYLEGPDAEKCKSASNAILYGWGSCQAYSDLFFLMTEMAGFSSGLISGVAGGSHIWNHISIGDQSYMVDVTFGDQGNQTYPRPNHYYFNFGRDRLATHTWYNENLDRSSITARTNDKYTFYSNKSAAYGKAVTSAKEAAQYCVQRIKKGYKYCEVLIKGKTYTNDQVHTAIRNVLGNVKQSNWSLHAMSLDGNTVVCLTWQKYNGKTIK